MIVSTLALMMVVIPKILDASPLTVYTGSMGPTFNPGDLIVVKPLSDKDKEGLDVGDVITFQPVSGDPTLITHRIIEKRSSNKGVSFITQGDANGVADEPLKKRPIMASFCRKILYHQK